jgi:hypothetical protein
VAGSGPAIFVGRGFMTDRNDETGFGVALAPRQPALDSFFPGRLG